MDKRLEQNNFKYMFNTQDNIVVLFDEDNRNIIEVNEAFYDYFNKELIESFNSDYKCFCDLFLEEKGYLSAKDYANWIDIVENNKTVNYKVKIEDKNKQIIVFLIKIKQTQRKNDNQFIITLTDITYFEDMMKTRSMLLANMTHEIRTPLGGVISFANLLLETQLSETQKSYANTIYSNANALMYLMNDLLDLSKLENGNFELHFLSTNIRDEIYDVVDLFSQSAADKNISLIPKIDTFLPYLIHTDPVRVKQILNNLLSNAIKFTSTAGDILIEAKYVVDVYTKGHKIIFSVSDSGIGIPQESIEKILEPFEQVDVNTSAKFGGTGLGLSIVTNLVNKFGGKLQIESKVGQGSTFSFDLPVEISTQINLPQLDIEDLVIGIATKEQELDMLDVITLKEQLGVSLENVKIIKTKNLKKLNSCDVVFIFDDMYSNDALELMRDNITTQIILIGKVINKQDIALKGFDEDKIIYHPIHTGKIIDVFAKMFCDPDILQFNDTSKEYMFANTNVLIAEDNITNQNFIKILLGNIGVDYVIAKDGIEVIERYRERQDYDFIFMDIMMPNLDGIEATKEILKIQKENKYPHIPIIALTANTLTGDKNKYLKAGMDDYLAKPIDKKSLKEILLKYVNKDKISQTTCELNIKKEENKKVSKINYDIDDVSEKLSIPIDFMKDLLEMFFDPIEDQLQELLEAIESTNYDQIVSISHDIKGASANLQLEEIMQLSKKLENAGNRKELVSCPANYEKLKVLLRNYKEELIDG